MSILPTPADRELEFFERLTVDISSRFNLLSADELPGAIESTLRDVAEALDVDRSTVVEMPTAEGVIGAMYFWARPGIPPLGLGTLQAVPWFLGLLRRGETVRLADLDRDLPPEATAERAYAREFSHKSILTIPVSFDGQLVSALSVGTFRHHRDWPEPLVERVRLIAGIIGAALQRRRHELALREGLAEIERLNRRLQAENLYLDEEIKSSQQFNEIVGESDVMRLALGRVEQVAPTDSTVMLLGESGTGKELFARAVHDLSPRRNRPLVRVNCAALPAGLIESELFGHEKGAFTGAVAQRLGRFEIADGGTLFLDEVAEIPLDLQGRLLRVLQEGEFERVGSSRTTRVDVRVIAATNRDLEAAVRDRAFRVDLYYRLTIFPITLPPLRHRPEDIPQLVWSFIARHQRRMGRHIKRVPRAAIEALQRYDWPGNVRELQNAVERAMIRSKGEVLEIAADFGFERRPVSVSTGDRSLATFERAHIEAVLEECGWRINGPNHAAEKLGLHPNTLRFRIKKLGITRPASARGARAVGR
jgi:formate hydrogenlyase transcriptional activator